MRALIVDDMLTMRHFLAMALTDLQGLEIEHASDGLDGAAKLRQGSYDIVLLDLFLPGMDGFELLTLVRGLPPPRNATHVIVISTAADEETRAKVGALGARFLPKPVRITEIRDCVRELCAVSRAEVAEHERRRASRLKVQVRARFEGREVLSLFTGDVNALGAFLICDKPEPVGTQGVVTIFFPHLRDPISVDATVIHNQPAGPAASPRGFGVRFDPKTPTLKAVLEAAFTSEGIDSTTMPKDIN